MSAAPSGSTLDLRLWPGITIAMIVVVLRFVLPLVAPQLTIIGILGAILALVLIVLWWLAFSRAPALERVAAIALMIGAVFLTRTVVHESIATGMMGNMLFVYAVPSTLVLAFVAWAIIRQRLAPAVRIPAMAVAILAGCLVWTLARTDGVTGEGTAQLKWRWSETAEERLLAQPAEAPLVAEPPAQPPAAVTPVAGPAPVPATTPPAPAASTPLVTPPSGPVATDPGRAEWSGFRGPRRDGIVDGVRIATDWAAAPPQRLWQRPVGPGWSSFAVHGDRIYTQEQRGEDEIIASYQLSTGRPGWVHKDPVRFWESNGGAGPRATPTLADGQIYAVGATGLVNVLDAATGRKIWSRDATSDTGAKVPQWGFSSSPVVVGDLVIVHAGGLVAYDRATGRTRWVGQSRRGSYSSPQLATIDGVPQIVQLNGAGAMGVSPADGTVLWEHTWEGTPIVQPFTLDGRDLLMASGDMMGGMGLRRISITHTGDTWSAGERWTSKGLKPYFNDFVAHQGHAYGFDGSILSCIELESGERKWKGGRYGQGQLLLLRDQDLLLILGEEGDLALVRATPEGYSEVARVKGIEGKTWNHPVLAGDTLLVRNSEQMAAFRVRLSARQP